MVTQEQYVAMSRKGKATVEREVEDYRHDACNGVDEAYRRLKYVCEGVVAFYDHMEFLPQEAKWPWKVKMVEDTVEKLRVMQGIIADTLRKVE